MSGKTLTEQYVLDRSTDLISHLVDTVQGKRTGLLLPAEPPARPETLAAELEAVALARKQLGVLVEMLKMWGDQVEAALVTELTEGEAVRAPSGRMAYRGKVSGGAACIRKEAFDELDPEALPPALRPRVVSTKKYPGVTELRKAAASGDITWELFRVLVSEAERVAGIRWATLDDDEGAPDAA